MKLTIKNDNIIEILFDLDLDGERDRVEFVESYLNTHNIFCSISQEFYMSDTLCCAKRMVVNKKYTNDLCINEVIESCKEFLAVIESESQKASKNTLFRFKSKSLEEYVDKYKAIADIITDDFSVVPRGICYDQGMFESEQIFEVILSTTDMIKLKLTYDSLEEALKNV